MGSNQQPLDYKPNVLPTELRREVFEVYCTVLYIATMLHLTAEPRGRPVASSMYHIISIKTENIAVDEIGRIICKIYKQNRESTKGYKHALNNIFFI